MERQRKKGRFGPVHPAFTLVELLVVITIIGMLVALLMSAVLSAREQGRRATCLSNQRQVGAALLGYEGSHGTFPGWQNSVIWGTTGATSQQSWLAMLLPNLERADMWQQILTTGSCSGTYLRVLTCPSDPPSTTPPPALSSYIANGLILRNNLTGSTTPPLTVEYISSNDGLTNTLLLGENTQAPPTAAAGANALAKAHYWSDVSSVSSGNGLNPQLAQTFGFPIQNPSGATVYSAALTTFAAFYGSGYSSPATAPYNFSQYNGNPMTANINSYHSGGANVIFSDGSGKFMRDDVGLNYATGSNSVTVYQILVTPDGSKLNAYNATNNTNGEPPADESQW